MAQRRHTLLIVDDEEGVLESLRHQFHRSYRVLTAEGGHQALEILGREDVHLILSDQRMPGMSGDEFLGHARRLFPDAIRMLFTGYADLSSVIRAVNDGNIYRYILKPWDPDELAGTLGQAAEQYDLLAERKRLIAELQAANAQLTRANAELAEAGQLKSAFIEVASHEFNTPITLVLGLSELLRLTDTGRDERERAIVERISGERPATGAAGRQHVDADEGRRLRHDAQARAGRAGPPAPRRGRTGHAVRPGPGPGPAGRGGRGPRRLRARRRQDRRRDRQPAHQRHQVHPRRRRVCSSRPGSPRRTRPRSGSSTGGSGSSRGR